MDAIANALRGHDLAGAALFGEIAHTHPEVACLPLGAFAGTQALIRDHMWAYAADRLLRGAALRMTHDTDPRLLAALWDCDARGRVCDDVRDVEDRVGYARLVLDDVGADRPDRFGVLALADPVRASSPRAWRETLWSGARCSVSRSSLSCTGVRSSARRICSASGETAVAHGRVRDSSSGTPLRSPGPSSPSGSASGSACDMCRPANTG